jgi:diaminohydroxyphosphoribosylaminopyrimidine deaminase / 5-amino-6-(5-phosphoribosylamino)uracil reductase
VITGIGTVLADDPALTVRDSRFADAAGIRQPLRVVVDSALRTPADARLFETPGPVLVIAAEPGRTRAPAFGDRAELLRLDGERPDLEVVLRELGRRGCNEVLIECGATLAGEVLARGLWDELLLYQAPKLLGHGGRPLATLDVATLDMAMTGTVDDVRRIGDDLRVRMLRQAPAE